VLAILLLAVLMVSIEGNHRILFGISISKAETSEALASAPNPLNRVFINQSFDTEPVRAIPTNWTILYPQYGNISVVNSTWYGSGATGKSGMILDSYTENNPVAYRLFPQQNGTVVISFAIKPTSNLGVKKTIEVYVDDSNFSGACIAFKNGQIGYQDRYYGFSVLRNSYVPDRWYKIKMTLNIPKNSYSIYIDDHLVQANAAFTGPCDQIHRIAFNETSGQDTDLLPVAFIDEILGVQGIEIPTDYGTIQEGINAANQGDIVFVTRQRTYFEGIVIPTGKDGIWLYGENVNTTIIDASFAQSGYGQSATNGISVHANNVRISGLTIRSTPYGAGIEIDGTYNTIENSIVINGLEDGIDVSAANNTITGSVIKTNLKCGVLITSSNTTLTGNIIESNDQQAVLVSGWNSDIEDNVIRSNLGCGIQILQGEQNLIRNNTIRKNGIGIECDANAKNNLIYENRLINNTLQASNADATNAWDDGYPYTPDREVGGGNFWSDFNSADMCSGKYQDQQNLGLLPAPDGICDRPYNLSLTGVDNYPLFLVQNVTQNPLDPASITYITPLNVTATILNYVDIGDAHLEVQLGSDRLNISMTISGNRLRGIVPAQKYGTNVTYNVTAHAESAEVIVKSANYPLSGPYFVGDKTGPTIGAPIPNPAAPTVNQPILITVNVTEPQNASGVNKVSLTYYVLGTPWTTNMNFTGNNAYSANIPSQTWESNLSMIITAIDNAGNPTSLPFNISTPKLTVIYKNVIYDDSCIIDFGVLSPGQIVTDGNLRFNNTGGGNLAWAINLTNVPTWLKMTPFSGTIASGRGAVVTITVNTTGLNKDQYEAVLTVTASGLVPTYRIIVRFITREIVIDDSYASSVAPRRSNVNTTQFYGFHATWTNRSESVVGMIKVIGIGWITVDEFGWANFTDTSLDPVERTYYVEDVNFTYQTYPIRNFTQEASNLTTIWDRVRITPGGSSHQITTVGKTEEVWFNAVYESDNTLLNGTNGVLYLDTYEYDLNTEAWNLKTATEPMSWSVANNRWEKSYSFDSQGSRNFTVSKVDDKLFNLTTMQNLAGDTTITWLAGGVSLGNSGIPIWAIVSIALTLGFGMTAISMILIKSSRNRISKEDFKTRKK
jgi:parallel beta-helix repeat protein